MAINSPLSEPAILGHLPRAACSEGDGEVDGCAVGFASIFLAVVLVW